ncbi:MAG TPA: hypothetical protein VN924_07850 [Bryobacteraceae bacterium]|nr:hypothetical protein [Bryobacteraceae bacterium]
MITRRALARLLGWALLPPAVRRGSAGAGDFNADFSRERRYRADAQILVLSLPILRRSGVGGGSVVWREWREPAGLNRMLEFNGYSNPDRAAGLNRLGLIREASRGEQAATRESSYFGVMTASPEESAEEAHKALHSAATEATYSAIRGRIAGGQVETATALFRGPARLSPERRIELYARAEQALSTAPNKAPEFRANGVIPPLFLHALADALCHPARGQTQYVYNGRLYRLWVRQTADPHVAASFRERGLIRAGAGVVRVAGKVRREAGGKETEFRLWVEEGAAQPLPLRIDFQPKAYLRLVFEAEG